VIARLDKRLREPVNGLTHLFGALIAGAGLALLVVLAWGEPTKVASLTLYGVALILMFSASAAYHLARVGPRSALFLRKLDHAAIYILIAGSYTPVCLHFFTGFWRDGLLAIVWALAVIGIVVKLFVIRAPRWATAGIYLLMGWMSVAALREIVRTFPTGALVWLVIGGLFYTAGAIVYILKRPDPRPGIFGFHEIWHLFVIAGAFSHFVLMAAYIAAAA
jgi:hemolysin III